MFRPSTRKHLTRLSNHLPTRRNTAAVAAASAKQEGDISSVFVSLSGAPAEPLPPRFASLKASLIANHEPALLASWSRLLNALKTEIPVIASANNSIIPTLSFTDLSNPPPTFSTQLKSRGVAIIRNVVSAPEALGWKQDIQTYIRQNPHTKAFPATSPAVYELYWSPSQVAARSHPNMLATQRFLMSHWHSAQPTALLSTTHPVAYSDRLRIRPPGDAGFALGPHVDGGSCERWERDGYGRGGVYDAVFRGEWEAYDPWEASARVDAVSDLYNGAGACSMFRMYQGWLAMSETGPWEGTLLVNPLFKLATAYYLLRPFFSPRKEVGREGYLEAGNWELDPWPTTVLQGASMGHAQELSEALHPHLDLKRSMVHVPRVGPGDYVAWHCDTIHAVDAVHMGKKDSSVLYVPTCPLTEANAVYLAKQREAFAKGIPGNDFPGGKGESEHVGRATPETLFEKADLEGQRAMGLTTWDVDSAGDGKGERAMLKRANEILGF